MRYWKKVVAYVCLIPLIIYPCFFLLLFGIMQGKAETKAWFIDAMIMINLEVWAFEPLSIFLLCVFPTQLIRHKVKVLCNPTHNALPVQGAAAHCRRRTSPRSTVLLKHRAMITRDAFDTADDSGDGDSMLARFFGVAYRAEAPLGSKMFFSFRVLSFILLMPEDVQKLFVDDLVKGLFALIAIGSQVVAALPAPAIIGFGVAIIAGICTFVSYCCCRHKPLPEAPVDSDSDDEDGIEELSTEHDHATGVVVLRF